MLLTTVVAMSGSQPSSALALGVQPLRFGPDVLRDFAARCVREKLDVESKNTLFRFCHGLVLGWSSACSGSDSPAWVFDGLTSYMGESMPDDDKFSASKRRAAMQKKREARINQAMLSKTNRLKQSSEELVRLDDQCKTLSMQDLKENGVDSATYRLCLKIKKGISMLIGNAGNAVDLCAEKIAAITEHLDNAMEVLGVKAFCTLMEGFLPLCDSLANLAESKIDENIAQVCKTVDNWTPSLQKLADKYKTDCNAVALGIDKIGKKADIEAWDSHVHSLVCFLNDLRFLANLVFIAIPSATLQKPLEPSGIAKLCTCLKVNMLIYTLFKSLREIAVPQGAPRRASSGGWRRIPATSRRTRCPGKGGKGEGKSSPIPITITKPAEDLTRPGPRPGECYL